MWTRIWATDGSARSFDFFVSKWTNDRIYWNRIYLILTRNNLLQRTIFRDWIYTESSMDRIEYCLHLCTFCIESMIKFCSIFCIAFEIAFNGTVGLYITLEWTQSNNLLITQCKLSSICLDKAQYPLSALMSTYWKL